MIVYKNTTINKWEVTFLQPQCAPGAIPNMMLDGSCGVPGTKSKAPHIKHEHQPCEPVPSLGCYTVQTEISSGIPGLLGMVVTEIKDPPQEPEDSALMGPTSCTVTADTMGYSETTTL